MTATPLKVTSHVARDLLQSAALFQHEQSVVWEYVSNGLEYVEPGVNPVVNVTVDVKGRKIAVRDNGRGMSADDLSRYFQMHGENVDRKKGKIGRGMFGTGKSAAFGIGDTLRVTTVRNSRRSIVQLERKDIEAAVDGQSIPVKVIERETQTSEPNGTTVEVENIHLAKMDVPAIIRHIERHIAHWPNANVSVNHQVCKVIEPAYSEEVAISSAGTNFESHLGAVTLLVRIAKAPLDTEWQGIAILSNGVWHTTTLAGCEGKPFSNYIFGELEVPKLAQDKSAIPPFDMSRSMRLNQKNPLVMQILAFIGSNIETIRRELERKDRERKKAKDAQRLQEEAQAIAKIINQDFDSWRNKVQKTVAQVSGGHDKVAKSGGSDGAEVLVPGSDIPAIVLPDEEPQDDMVEPKNEAVNGGSGWTPPEKSDPGLEKVDKGSDHKAKSEKKGRSGTSGGFKVEFIAMGTESSRAKYEREQRTIFINLEHPQIAAAKSIAGIEDVAFRRLAYEVAFSEYSIALASELANGDWYMDITDPIIDIRETLNRISRSAASLYAD